jgi:hypothetical protein
MVSALISVGGMSSLQGSGDLRRTQGGLHGKIPAYAGGSGATVDCRKGDHEEHIDFVNFGTKNERERVNGIKGLRAIPSSAASSVTADTQP